MAPSRVEEPAHARPSTSGSARSRWPSMGTATQRHGVGLSPFVSPPTRGGWAQALQVQQVGAVAQSGERPLQASVGQAVIGEGSVVNGLRALRSAGPVLRWTRVRPEHPQEHPPDEQRTMALARTASPRAAPGTFSCPRSAAFLVSASSPVGQESPRKSLLRLPEGVHRRKPSPREGPQVDRGGGAHSRNCDRP